MTDDFEDLQAKMRTSGAVQLDPHRFRTKEGTVVLMSPADEKRMRLLERMAPAIDRSRKWELGPTIEGAEPLVGEPEDE